MESTPLSIIFRTMTENEMMIRLQFLKESIHYEKRKYFQIESVENFLIHLGELKKVIGVEKTLSDIELLIERMEWLYVQRKSDMQIAEEIRPYVWEIGLRYRAIAGFTLKQSILLNLIVAIFVFIVIQFLIAVKPATLVVGVPFVLITTYGIIKRKQRRVCE